MADHYLLFTAGVTPQIASEMAAYLVELAGTGTRKLTMAISSPGGNVTAGVTIHNTLLAMPFEVEMHNIGNVDSIANVIFLAGSRRFASPDASFMFHGVGFDGNQNERLEEKNIFEKLDTIRADHTRIAGIVAARTKLTQKACMALLRQQRTRGAAWAKTNGLIDDLGAFHIPTKAQVRLIS